MRNRIIAALVALAAALGIGLGVASPAQAAWADCPDHYFCLWTGINGNATGTRYQWHYNTFVDSYHNGIRLPSGISNRGWSFYNRSHAAVIIFDAVDCNTGSWNREMQNNQYASAPGSDWGGRVSSLQLWNASPLRC
jgi:hypothetical protein